MTLQTPALNSDNAAQAAHRIALLITGPNRCFPAPLPSHVLRKSLQISKPEHWEPFGKAPGEPEQKTNSDLTAPFLLRTPQTETLSARHARLVVFELPKARAHSNAPTFNPGMQ